MPYLFGQKIWAYSIRYGIPTALPSDPSPGEPTTPQLASPIISISGNTLTITEGSGLDVTYIIYVGGQEKGSTKEKTLDLKTLSLSAGTHTITVIASADGYLDSAESNAVSYEVASGGSGGSGDSGDIVGSDYQPYSELYINEVDKIVVKSVYDSQYYWSALKLETEEAVTYKEITIRLDPYNFENYQDSLGCLMENEHGETPSGHWDFGNHTLIITLTEGFTASTLYITIYSMYEEQATMLVLNRDNNDDNLFDTDAIEVITM